MRPGTGDRPAAPCRTPLRPVLRHCAIPPRHHSSGPRLRTAPSVHPSGPAPAPTRFVRSRPRPPPQAPPFRSAPADHLLPGSGPPPPPPHNRGADAALPAAPSGTTTHAPRPDPLAARASPGRDIAIFPIFFRIIGFARDTPSRHNQAIACFCTRFFVSLAPLKIRRSG